MIVLVFFFEGLSFVFIILSYVGVFFYHFSKEGRKSIS